MASIGELTARLGLDTTEFRAQAAGAEQTLRNLSSDMRAGINTAGRYAFAIGAIGSALGVELVRHATDAGQEIQNLSRLSGTSAETFQKQAYAAKMVNVESDKLADIYKDVQDKVGDFLQNGGGPLQDFFNNIAPKVGVTAKQFQNLSGPQALQLYVDSLQKANISQGDMAFYMEAVASDSTKLLPLLRNNGQYMKQLGDEAKQTGAVLSNFDVQRLADASQTVKQLGATFEATAYRAVANMTPSLNAIMQGLQQELPQAADTSEQSMVSWAGVLNKIVAFSADAVSAAIHTIGTGFMSIGDTVGAGTASIVAAFQGDLQRAENIAQDWADNESKMWGHLLNDENFHKYRDALDDVLKKQQQGAGAKMTAPSLPGDYFPGQNKTNSNKTNPNSPHSPGGATDPNADNADMIRGATQSWQDNLANTQQQDQGRFDQIRGQLQSPMEREKSQHQGRQQFLQAAADGRIDIEGDANKQIEKEAQRHKQAMEQIGLDQGATLLGDQKSYLSQIISAQSQAGKQMYSTLAGAFEDITAAGATQNKALFEANKIAGVANAIISTQVGAAKALELGWPLGPIAAAAIIANGAARVKAIESQSFGSGGGKTAPSTAAGTSAPAVEDVSKRNGGDQSSGANVYIDASGRADSEKQSIRAIADGLSDYLSNGGKIAGITVTG